MLVCYNRRMKLEDYDRYFMNEALKEANKSLVKDDVPIGCVIVKDNHIIGRGHNVRQERQDATMHAEIMAIQEANRHEKSWRLLETTLYVTIEPCIMCAGAIGLARLPRVVYGAKNAKFGGVNSLYHILADERLNHQVEVRRGILEEECAVIMQEFFHKRRDGKMTVNRK